MERTQDEGNNGPGALAPAQGNSPQEPGRKKASCWALEGQLLYMPRARDFTALSGFTPTATGQINVITIPILQTRRMEVRKVAHRYTVYRHRLSMSIPLKR